VSPFSRLARLDLRRRRVAEGNAVKSRIKGRGRKNAGGKSVTSGETSTGEEMKRVTRDAIVAGQ